MYDNIVLGKVYFECTFIRNIATNWVLNIKVNIQTCLFNQQIISVYS